MKMMATTNQRRAEEERQNRQKYRWEIDPKTNEVKRVRAEQMHYQAFDDFKKILEKGAEKARLDLSPRERARARAAAKSRKAELARRRKYRSDTSSDSSSVSNLTPRQRTARRRRRLRKKVTKELRRCDNTVRLMKSFPPVFHEQCNGLSGGLKTLGGLFHNAVDEVNDLEAKIAKKRARIEAMDQQYRILKKRRTRLMFNKLADKAARIVAKRKRIKEIREREDYEERINMRQFGRYGGLDDSSMTDSETLELMADKQPHANMALMLNAYLDSAAPPRSKPQIEYKLHVGDLVNSFLRPADLVESTAKDIIQSGVQEFFRTKAKQKLLGGGEDSAFDKQFGTEFDEDEYVGFTEADVADMKPEEVTRYYAWQRWTQKQKELQIAIQIADQDAENAMVGMKTTEELAGEDTDDEDEELFAILNDF